MLQEVLNKTGLNWEVIQQPLFSHYADEEGNIVDLDTPYFGQFRTDTYKCLGVSSSRYHVSQNSDVIQLLLEYFGSDLKVENVDGGQIKGGKRIYFTIKQNDLFAGTTAHLEQRLIIRDSHDGSSPITIGFQDKVLVCSNGMTRWMDRKDGKAVRIMHTASMSKKLQQFEAAYAKYLELNKKKEELYESWMSSKVSMDLARDLINKLNDCDVSLSDKDFRETFSTRKLNIVQKQLECIELEMNRQGSTKWGLLNGITNYTTHHLGSKKSEDQRFESLLDGSGYTLNNKAFTLIETM